MLRDGLSTQGQFAASGSSVARARGRISFDQRVARYRRRAATGVVVAVTAPVILGFGALTIDLGRLYVAKNELQVSADAAALAGVSAYVGTTGQAVTLAQTSFDSHDTLATQINTRTRTYAGYNRSNSKETKVADQDIVKGRYSFTNPSASLDSSSTARFNAVQVTLSRTSGGVNEPVNYLFGPILGLKSGQAHASATAAVNDRMAGYDVTLGTAPMLPFTIGKTLYDQMVATGSDAYAYNSSSGQVIAAPDGIREVDIFPVNTGASGNLGLLYVPTSGGGTNTRLRDQIDNNISNDDIESTFHTTNLVFTQPDGSPVTYGVYGEPGLRSTLESDVNQRVGDVVGIFLHSSFTGSGSNTLFTIVGIRFVRIMHVDLSGTTKHLYVQPVVYAGPGLTVQNSAPSTNGNVGVLMLVR
ncbi:MAG TPA: pilus assembly protein TadG-related protein [Phycisphaerae bacterium]|jgi:Flp pilus assembly protein TadG